MARSGLYKSDVQKARDSLRATGLGKAVTFRPAPGQVTELACSSGKSQL